MSDQFRIDSHKLMYHIGRLQQWLQGKNIYPLYLEIGLYGGCNHRCVFCAFDFINYQPVALNTESLKKFILEAKKRGVKAILYSGEGEPLLHPDAAQIIHFTKQAGIDVALVSNGVGLSPQTAKRILPYLSWLKISLNAGKKLTYVKVHRAKPDDFNRVLNNLREAVRIRNKHHYPCVIGAQSVLLHQNFQEMPALAEKLRGLGIDYLVIKPYSQHCFSRQKPKASLKSKNLEWLKKKLKPYARGKFQVILRLKAMEKITAKKPYDACLGFPFIAHITDTGDVYPCTVFIGQPAFKLGNIYAESFRSIWEGLRRKQVLKRISAHWDIQRCRQSCRMDEINRYLWELKHPVEHINFI